MILNVCLANINIPSTLSVSFSTSFQHHLVMLHLALHIMRSDNSPPVQASLYSTCTTLLETLLPQEYRESYSPSSNSL